MSDRTVLDVVLEHLTSPEARGGVRVVLPDGVRYEIRLDAIQGLPPPFDLGLSIDNIRTLMEAVRVEWPIQYPETEEPPGQSPPTGPECYRRATELLEQAFATQSVNVGDPWGAPGAPEIRPVLPESERLLCIEAAQAYAALAHAAATAADRIVTPQQRWGGHDLMISDQCRHGEPEGSCASCAACAACRGECGICPYAPKV